MGHRHHVSLMPLEGGSLEGLPTYMITYINKTKIILLLLAEKSAAV